MINFHIISEKRLSHNFQKKYDPAMYAGSPGILYALYKYSLLLRKETNNIKPDWLEPKLQQAIDKNMDLAA